MPTISEYSQGLVIPKYNTTDYSNQLEIALLQKKQSQYNTIVQRLSNMQSTALNVNMLNLKGKEKLDMYNRELEDMLSEDPGDLTDTKIQARVGSYFNKISQDTDLKRRSRLSSHYQKQLNMIDNMRNAKDPTKSGYNSINETVFRKWEGGLEDFMMADNINGWENKQQSYTPFKDIDQKLVNLTKLLHAESQTTQKPLTQKVTVNDKEMEVPTGYDVLESTSGVSAERIRTLLESTLDQDERSQLDVLAKYRIIENSSPEGLVSMHTNYSRWVKTEHQNTKRQLEQIKGLKLQLDPSKIDSSLSPEEQAVKKALYQNELDKLNEQEQYLTTKLGQQLTNEFTQEEWLRKSPNELLPYIRQMTIEGYVNGVSDALSTKNEVQKVGMDETYFAKARISNMQDRLQLDAELDRAGLKLKEMELNYKINKDKEESSANKFSPPGDIIKSESNLFDTWNTVTDLQKSFNNKTTPIVSSKDDKGNYQIDPKNLVNKAWLEKNSGNHEVRLWNTYVAKNRDSGAFLDQEHTKPNLAGFDLFKKQVQNGDYKNDPTINNIMSEYDRDLEVAGYLNDKTKKVSKAINDSTDYKKVAIGEHTLEDYARVTTGWTPDKGELTFNVRDGKGGYQTMTWTEVKEEYYRGEEKRAQRAKQYVPTSTQSVIPSNKTEPTSNLDNDPPFKVLVGQAIIAEQKSSEIIKQTFLNELPQFQQGKQSISSDPKTITNYMNYLNEATKLAGEDVQMSLTPDYVSQISVPVGFGDYGYFVLTKAGSKVYEGHKLVGVDGEPKTPIEGEWYRYKPPVANQYDQLLNAKFDDTGFIKRNIQGYSVTINNVPGENQVKVQISGNGVNKEITSPKKDVSLILKEVENSIKMLNVKPK